jgi:hypothetical protein
VLHLCARTLLGAQILLCGKVFFASFSHPYLHSSVQGCPSWNWFYPFHYAPFASDLVNIDQYTISFELAKPFRPVEQLLAVLPAESVNALPEECRWLMTDASSPIRDIYISDAPLDPNGKHMPWLWVLLLPFVDENRISAAFELCKESLSLESRYKNAFGDSLIFLHQEHEVAVEYFSNASYGLGVETDAEVLSALSAWAASADNSANVRANGDENSNAAVVFDPLKGRGMSGILSNPVPRKYAPQQASIAAMKKPPHVFDDIASNKVVCLTYHLPGNVTVSSSLLPGYVGRPSILSEYDLLARRPPRLGKGSFNMINIVLGNQSRNPQQRSYQHNQSNGHGMHSYNQSRDDYHRNNYNSSGRDSNWDRNRPPARPSHAQPPPPMPYFTVPHPQQVQAARSYAPRPTQPYPAYQTHAQPYATAPRNQYAIPPPPVPPSRFSFSPPANPPHFQPINAPSLDDMRSQLSQLLHSRQSYDQSNSRPSEQSSQQPRSGQNYNNDRQSNYRHSGNSGNYRRY